LFTILGYGEETVLDAPETKPEEIGPPDRFVNRELSWLDFNERVLALAESPRLPLLERVKFLAIFASNLDEFYMVRVAGLMRQVDAGVAKRSPDGLTPRAQLEAIADRVFPIVQRHAELWRDEIAPALKENEVAILRWGELEDHQRKDLDDLFREKVFPVVTPLAVDPGHPFPYVSNLSLNLAVLLRDTATDKLHFARIKVPPLLPRFMPLPESGQFVPLEDVISANLDQLFPGMNVVEHHAFRVTRNADLEVNDDGAEDLLQALEDELRKRRFSPAVRLEAEEGISEHVLDLLTRELEITENDVHLLPAPLDFTGLWTLYDLERPELKDEPFTPAIPAALSSTDDHQVDVFEVLRSQDVLVHHPYESFTASVQRFIRQAAQDPNVLAIKQTLYRTSGDSPIVEALIDAAEAGKQVVVLVEIKARFDERNNINWARALERAGCHVVYGLVGLKTHCKLCLVVRREGDHVRRYVHVGTGNYNPKTARIYEDLGLLTADPQLGADVTHLFNYLTGYSRKRHYRSLIVSPHSTRARVVDMIERETEASSSESPGRIVMKMNSLVDEAVIDALYRASQAHVDIDLIIRGICALRPGVEGLSERISVRSILGRYLEHSRIFYFRNGGLNEYYIGSADMMHRNLDRRVEALVNVRSTDARRRLEEVLELCLEANTDVSVLGPDGGWSPLQPHDGGRMIEVQDELMRRARTDA
jgi:polyphosphate kinase